MRRTFWRIGLILGGLVVVLVLAFLALSIIASARTNRPYDVQGAVVGLAFVSWWGFVLWYWNRQARRERKSLDEGWGDFAQLRGLAYKPGGRSLGGMKSAFKKPSVSGEYRGRELMLAVHGSSVSVHDGTIPIAFTTVSLHTNNPAGCSLIVREKGYIRRLFSRGKKARALEGLDPRFVIDGHPPDFLLSVMPLISDLTRQRTTMGVNRSAFFWTSRSKLPSISLEGSRLIWQQYDVVEDPKELNYLLDLLSNLAEVAERQV